MKVYVAYDGKLRVRIGKETLGSESLGRWYGGTGAIRLRQVLDTWFWAYRLDDHGYRGTGSLPETEFGRVREHIPSACIVEARGRNLHIRISEADLRTLEGKVVPLRTPCTGPARRPGAWRRVGARVRPGESRRVRRP
jgi:hypothetical protein